MYRTDYWINERSGWIAELIESQYINISTYKLLSGNTYIKFSTELISPKKGLINIKNNDQKCFHIRHINPVKIHPETITQTNKELANYLDYDGIKLPVDKENFSKIETKSNICINVYCYENKLVFPIHISDQKFETSIDLLLVIDEDNSHYLYIIYTDLYFTKQSIKTKNTFARVSYSVLVVKMC